MHPRPSTAVLLAVLTACGGPDAAPVAPQEAAEDAPNVLIVLVDDLGVDKVSSYGMHPDAPLTPRIDALAAEGQRFTQAWAYPVCSPTRAA